MNAPLALKGVGRSVKNGEPSHDQLVCAYCRTQWGPWTGVAIAPCPRCARPLFLTSTLLRQVSREKVSGLLDSINAIQGMVVLLAILGLLLGLIQPRTLGQTIAMAMFVAATAHTTDGVLGMRTGILRVFGTMIAGSHAKPAAVAKIAMGVVAFGMSLFGILLFSGPPR
jgi:hypothetical protein